MIKKKMSDGRNQLFNTQTTDTHALNLLRLAFIYFYNTEVWFSVPVKVDDNATSHAG